MKNLDADERVAQELKIRETSVIAFCKGFLRPQDITEQFKNRRTRDMIAIPRAEQAEMPMGVCAKRVKGRLLAARGRVQKPKPQPRVER